VFICVHLWLKKFIPHPKKASISFAKICENPSKTPHRQAPSTLNFFWALGGRAYPPKYHENYETNPKQFLPSLFKCNGFSQSGCFFLPAKRTQNSRRQEITFPVSLNLGLPPGRAFSGFVV